MNLINETDYNDVSNCLNDMINIVVKREERRLYARKYNKSEKGKKKSKEYREKHKDKENAYAREYQRRPICKEKKKEYNKSEKGRKVSRIANWKRMGLICDDIDALYDKFLNTPNCENCNCILTMYTGIPNIDRHNTLTYKCMDHDHNTGLFRNILCTSCNVKRR